ncbi:hypothetical protein CsSME_00007012 [Camellia sinensis var. sinensis]
MALDALCLLKLLLRSGPPIATVPQVLSLSVVEDRESRALGFLQILHSNGDSCEVLQSKQALKRTVTITISSIPPFFLYTYLLLIYICVFVSNLIGSSMLEVIALATVVPISAIEEKAYAVKNAEDGAADLKKRLEQLDKTFLSFPKNYENCHEL